MQTVTVPLVLTFFSAVGCGPREQAPQHAPLQGEPDLSANGVRRATGLSAVDLNGDHKLDLIMLSGETGKMAVLLNATDRSLAFKSPILSDVGTSASDLATGDFDEDGRTDIAVCHHDTAEVWVLVGKGDGTFQTAKKVHLSVTKPHAHRIATADFNQDKHLDLLVAESDDNRACVLLGNGKGGFTAGPGSPIATGKHPYVVQAGDFNHDGSMDFATPNWFDKSVSVFLGNGRGEFRQAPGSPHSGFAAPTAMSSGDLNGDGNLDIVVGNNGERGLQVMVGDGKGGFSLGARRDLKPQGPCFQPEVADLNGDGKHDVMATATNGARTFSYWLNQGGGRFDDAISLPCPSGANTLCAADLDGDGLVDVAVGTWEGDKTLIWRGERR